MMRRMFTEIGDPVRAAALEKAIGALNENRFPWNDRYVATAEPGHMVEVTMAGIAGEQFIARTATAILKGAITGSRGQASCHLISHREDRAEPGVEHRQHK
jgi:hypothetical protein